MNAERTLSLCICTRNRPEDLKRCLESVAAGTRIPDQVIVSDDSDDGCNAKNLVTSYSFVQYQRGPKIGLGANRNACIAATTSTHVSFIDDDVTLPASFVENAFSFVTACEGSGAPFILTGTERKHSSHGVSIVGPGNPDFWGYQRLPPQDHYRAIVINAAVFPASLFRSALFDAQLRYGSEEIDMARHAVALGYKICFHATLQVDHYPSEINRSEYAHTIDASRMYATAKDYWHYQHSLGKTLIFALTAPPKLAVALGRRSGFNGVKAAVNATRLAVSYFQNSPKL
jgi:glycosyltransferase involved in cell wall biosynthesis